MTLAPMALLSFLARFVLMYAMVDRIENALPNLNQVYMAALMAAPMARFELALTRHMYPAKKWAAAAIGISVIVFARSFFVHAAADGNRRRTIPALDAHSMRVFRRRCVLSRTPLPAVLASRPT